MRTDGGRTIERTPAAVGGRPPGDEALDPIDAARRFADRERSEVRSELRALERFEERVAHIDVAGARTRPIGLSTADENGDGDGMDRVRSAYRETMMAVSHYERVYGEPFESNVAAELGPDIASGVCDGGNAAYTPQLKAALLAAVGRAREERRGYVDVLDRETDSLDGAKSALRDVIDTVPEDFDGLADAVADSASEAALLTALDRLDAVAGDRQRLIHGRVSTGRADGHDLCEHLYGDAPWTYPVLSAVTALRRAIEG